MRPFFFVLAFFAAAAAHAGDVTLSDCQEFTPRSAAISAAGVTRVTVIGGAGFLHVEGRAEATEIRADGRACASIEELLIGMHLEATRSGNEVTIKATVPDQKGSRLAAAPRLDFTVTLPSRIAVDVGDLSGETTVTNVRRVRVAGKTNDIAIRDIGGDVAVQNTSGAVRVQRVAGSVTIDKHDSGAIDVSDVHGDLIVKPAVRGAVDYKRVAGRVSIPRGR